MRRIKVIRGDITSLDVDAIVNAANTSLLGGAGVDGAIHRAGGHKILEECMAIRDRQGGCEAGQAVVTSGGDLKAKFVIHTVGPVWEGGSKNEDALLSDAYTNSLAVAVENGVKTIAFPNISTGVYGFPKGRAAEIATRAAREFLENTPILREVIFCCFDEENFKIYNSIQDL